MDKELLRRRAQAGNCAAQTILGIEYLYGNDNVEVDYCEAFRFLSAAARAGASRAVLNLAHMYVQGLATPRDINRAIDLYESIGNSEFYAAIALARIYAEGLHVPRNEARAVDWYSVATSFQNRIFDCDELNEAKTFISQARGSGDVT